MAEEKERFFNDLETFGNLIGYFVCKKIYKALFNHRCTSFKPLGYEMSDFPAFARMRHEFLSSKKEKLVGYIYQYPNIKKDKIMVFAHGYGGGGHNTYLNLIEYFARQGFYVFAYDATANDESAGKGIYTFTQGIFDADRAISYVESLKEYEHLPLIICGHSWGAFSMSNALHLHKRVKCLIAFSGFNNATSIFHANGEIFSKDYSEENLKHIDEIERTLSGKYADLTAIDSFKDSDAQVIIVHSNDDRTVPTLAGIDLYENQFKNNDRFTFIRLENKGHGTVYFSTEGKTYFDNTYKLFSKQVKAQKLKGEEREKLGFELFNHDKMLHLLNEQLLDQIVELIK